MLISRLKTLSYKQEIRITSEEASKSIQFRAILRNRTNHVQNSPEDEASSKILKSIDNLFFLKNLWMEYSNNSTINFKDPVVKTFSKQVHLQIDPSHLTHGQKSLYEVISASLDLSEKLPALPSWTSKYIFAPLKKGLVKFFGIIFLVLQTIFLIILPVILTNVATMLIIKQDPHHFIRTLFQQKSGIIFVFTFNWIYFAR